MVETTLQYLGNPSSRPHALSCLFMSLRQLLGSILASSRGVLVLDGRVGPARWRQDGPARWAGKWRRWHLVNDNGDRIDPEGRPTRARGQAGRGYALRNLQAQQRSASAAAAAAEQQAVPAAQPQASTAEQQRWQSGRREGGRAGKGKKEKGKGRFLLNDAGERVDVYGRKTKARGQPGKGCQQRGTPHHPVV